MNEPQREKGRHHRTHEDRLRLLRYFAQLNGKVARTEVIHQRTGVSMSALRRHLTAMKKEGIIGYERKYWGLRA